MLTIRTPVLNIKVQVFDIIMQHNNCKCHPYYHATSTMLAPKDWDRVLWIGLPSFHNHPPCSGSAVDKNDRNHQSQINRRHKYTTLTPQRYTTKGDKHCQASIHRARNKCTTHKSLYNIHVFGNLATLCHNLQLQICYIKRIKIFPQNIIKSSSNIIIFTKLFG